MFISPISLRTKHNQNLQQAPQTKSTSKQAFFFLFFFRLTFSGTSPARATYPPLKGSRPHVTNATKHRDLGSRSRVFAKKQTNKTSTRQHIRTSTFTSCVQEFGVFIFTHKFDLLKNKLKLSLSRLIESSAVYDRSCSCAAVQGCSRPTRKASRSDGLGMVRLLTTLSYEQRVNK